MSCFQDLPLSSPIQKAISDAGYVKPTEIQQQAIPALLQQRDLLGCAQTGTGKTAAFALPILDMLSKPGRAKRSKRRTVRALVLAPTRELAAQIIDSFRKYGRHVSLKSLAVYGGVSRGPQAKKARMGTDILVATPGRLLDLADAGDVDLSEVEIFVLDEADRMLDMGFIPDIKRIISKLPQKRQTLFFSATMPKSIAQLSGSMLQNPVRVEVAPQATPAERVEQSVVFVDQARKTGVLETILDDKAMRRVLVFTRTKRTADRVAKSLMQKNISAEAIHGNKSQNIRTRTIQKFRSGSMRVLVATDLVARGIDVDGVTHVINYELPNEPECYVHRIGRTGRAGSSGHAISFCAGDERDYLRLVEKTMRMSIAVNRSHPDHSEEAERGLVDGQDGVLLRKQEASRKMAQRQPNAARPGRSGGGRSGGGGRPGRPGGQSGRPGRKPSRGAPRGRTVSKQSGGAR